MKNNPPQKNISALHAKFSLAIIVLLAGIVISFALFFYAKNREQKNMRSDFDLRANTRISDIADRIQDNLEVLVSLASFYVSSREVTREEFHVFTGSLLQDNPGIKAFMWLPRISSEELAAYRQAAIEGGYPDFKFKETDAKTTITAGAGGREYFPAYFVEPLDENKIIFGVDFGGSSVHRTAMKQAASSGLPAATAKIPLIRDSNSFGYKVFVAVYRKDASFENPRDRRLLSGFLGMLIDFKEMFSVALQDKPLLSMDTYLYDDNASGDNRLLYYHVARTRTKENQPVVEDKKESATDLVKNVTLNVAGRTWRVVCRPAPRFFDVHKGKEPWIILIIGLLLTAALSCSLFIVLGRKAQVEALVYVRTKELEASENRFRSIVSNFPGAIYRCANDAYWTMEFISDQILNICGYPAQDFLQNRVRSYASIIYLEDAKAVDETIQEGLRKGEPYAVEYRIIDSRGNIKWVYEKGQGFCNESGSVSWLDGFIFDITERKKSEEQLRQLWRAIEQSPATVVITDKEGKIEYANPKFVQLTGYTLAEAVGQNPRVLKSGAHPQEFYKQLWDTILSDKEWRGEFLNKKKNGELYWESASISPLKNSRGGITHFVAVKEDITERKKLERVKDDFVSTVSHELRTPLTAIKEGIAVVLDGTTGAVSAEQKEFLGLAKRNVDRLSRLINEVLDFQKLESGAMVFYVEENDINAVAQDVAQTMQTVAKQKGLKLALNLGENIPPLPFDRDKIIQVLMNLVNNAVKFTASGSISIATVVAGNTVRVSVQDAGAGIAKEDLSKLFGKFVQLSTGGERKAGGTGLGLAISKEIIEWHQGKIWAESQAGQGTTFHFILPVKERRV